VGHFSVRAASPQVEVPQKTCPKEREASYGYFSNVKPLTCAQGGSPQIPQSEVEPIIDGEDLPNDG
jgi:hypothetical protein